MIQKEFKQARELIQQKRYDEAREILHFIDHPKATEWLEKLDKIDPQFEIPSEQPEYVDPWADGSKRITWKKLGLVLLVLAAAAYFNLYVLIIPLNILILWFIFDTVKNSAANEAVKQMKSQNK